MGGHVPLTLANHCPRDRVSLRIEIWAGTMSLTADEVLLTPPQAAGPALPPPLRLPDSAPKQSFHSVLGGLFRSRLFVAVLAVKVVCGCLAASYYLRDLFTPFLNYYVGSGFSNPWTHFASLGRLNSFPYPPMMLYIMAVPRMLVSPFLAAGVDRVTPAHLAVMRVPLLLFDILIAGLLISLYPHRRGRILAMYWCSPVVFYVCYWHGQLDVIPTGLLLASIVVLGQGRYQIAMLIFACAAASKSHVWVALPFLLAYIGNRYGTKAACTCFTIAVGAYLAIIGPYLGNPAFREMVFGTKEQARVFAYQFPFGSSFLSVMIAPFALLCLFFRFVAYERRSWDLLLLYTGICFSCFVLLVPPQPGYVLWSMPFIIHFACRRREVRILPLAAYSCCYLGFFWLGSESDLFDAWKLVNASLATFPLPQSWLAGFDPSLPALAHNLVFTAMQASLGSILLYMYVMGVRDTAAHNARKTPVLIGVAGDSGTGKNTFAMLTTALLGPNRTTMVCGDDYHRWERGDQMWNSMTHLNVSANDVHRQQQHLIGLSRGLTIFKTIYDHNSGRFTEKQACEPNDVIVFQGLHALATISLRSLYDLRVFLDPQEELRQFWKIQRDTRDRSYSPDEVLRILSNRDADRRAYVLPQREQAELVVRWCISNREAEPGAEPHMELNLRALNGFDFSHMIGALRAGTKMAIHHEPYLDANWQSIRLSGNVAAATLSEIARDTASELLNFFQATPQFASDLPGCLQLVTLICLKDKLSGAGQPLWGDR
jgi:uridine kinase